MAERRDTPHRPLRVLCTLATVVALAAVVATAEAGRLESELSRELRGAWAVLMVEVSSDCAGFYNNNEANLSGVASGADRRFAPGELAKIDKINLKRSRLDLFLTLAEPVLKSRHDGPFELFDERECKVQLMIPMDRELTRHGPVAAILERVGPLLETWPNLGDAQGSPAWNERRREPYPEDYELTLARYRVWQAEQVNAAVAARIAAATEEGRAAVATIRRDTEYLDGFAAGVEHLRSWSENDCDDLLEVELSSVADRSPSKDHSRPWKDGYEQGQRLVFALEVARRLEGCFVPVPPMPAGDWP